MPPDDLSAGPCANALPRSDWAFQLGIDAALSRIVLAMVVTVTLAASGHAQPCNPAIDGTYCASQSRNVPSVSSSPMADSRISLSADIAQPGLYDQPATLGAITFNGDGTRCIGLLRRAGCR